MEGYRDRWFVGGIVSWGVECATPSLPGVYANVPMYTEWIKNRIRTDERFSAMDEERLSATDDEYWIAIVRDASVSIPPTFQPLTRPTSSHVPLVINRWLCFEALSASSLRVSQPLQRHRKSVYYHDGVNITPRFSSALPTPVERTDVHYYLFVFWPYSAALL